MGTTHQAGQGQAMGWRREEKKKKHEKRHCDGRNERMTLRALSGVFPQDCDMISQS